jgi:leishmanolysin-like peptidase
VALADYCPYIQEFTWRSNNVVVRGSHCMYEENNPSKFQILLLLRLLLLESRLLVLKSRLLVLKSRRFYFFSGHDRNFALENYSPLSKCFDHTDKMWEEMNCQQVRQWQHWGSGCYNYLCKNGRLHIEVLNNTFTCFYPRQEIPVSLLSNQWLHTGSLVCPPCEEVCGAEFRKQHQKCRPGVVPPKNYAYHYDSIACNSDKPVLSRVYYFVVMFFVGNWLLKL